ncbi:MAG: hypothetical protein LUQ37_06090, partial [Methanoregulaceae archaeon]|nr:hypothetical protein [Methanoregulaceae archaeon]
DERTDDPYARGTRLNIFSANVITLRSMLFGNVPRVEVSRRYEDADDDAARVAAEMLERIANSDIGKQFSYAIGGALDDRLLVGFGLARVAYEADFETIQQPPFIAEDGTELAPGYSVDRKTMEAAPVYYLNWRDVLWSPARTWDEVRWIGFRNYLTRDQCVERFGETIGENIPLGTSKRSTRGGIENDPWQKAEVWEIWCLEDKTVYWVAEGMDVICDAKEDPLQLEGFFPCPQFMLANPTSQDYVPRADYILAQDQYDELNDVTTRITMLEKAIKVVGVYDKSADGVQRMLNELVDNELVPVDNWAMFAEKGGIKGQVDWLPIEEVAGALEILRNYRTELVNLLYQVTGMSDILRGATQSGETATAQSIKAKFASTRVQAMQDDFARFATDLQRLRIEIISRHFDDQSIVAQSNLQATPDAEYIPQALQLIRSMDAFKISIKSETLAAQDLAALRQEKQEFIQGLASFLTAAQPLVEKYPAAAPTLLEMLKWAMTGFKGSSTIEGVLDKAIASLQQQPPAPQADPAEAKMKAAQAAQQMKLQGDAQREKMKSAAKGQEIQMQTQADIVRINAETQAELKKQQAQFAFDSRESQRAAALDAVTGVTQIRRPGQ